MGYRGRSYHAWLLGSAAAIAISSAASAADNTQFDIAPQPLASALNEFSLQSHQSVLFTTDLAAAKSSQGVSGQVQVADALSSLLAGTGLSWKKQGDTFLIVSASDPQSGSAAGDGAEGTVQALVVTAQKREENIQDVPIAMSAFSQEDLTKSQVAGGPDLMTQVPNFTFTKTNFSSYSIQIRGIGTQAISATVDPAVAVAFNNTPFIRNRFFEQEFYDLQRVEVLRGPQGTLYGRNATAGVVNIISTRPSLHDFEAKVSADVSNYNSTRVEGMVNLPIVDDKVGFRLAGAWTKRNGYDTNQITGNSIDGRDLWSARASLRFEPVDWFRANLIYEHFQENDDRLRSGKQLCKKNVVTDVGDVAIGYSGVPGNQADFEQAWLSQGCEPASLYSPDSFDTPNGWMLPYYAPLWPAGLPVHPVDPYVSTTQSRDLRTIESTVDPHYRAKSDLGELQIAVDLGHHLTLTSESGYNRDFIFSSEDYNRFNTAPGAFEQSAPDYAVANVLKNGVFCDPQIGCADRLVAEDLSTAKSWQFSQEFRLSSDFGGPANFSFGVNFLRYDTEDKYYVFVNTLSILSAMGRLFTSGVDASRMPPYTPGVSDNSQCQRPGLIPGYMGVAPTFLWCVYMDPNPINNLNDLGHNYFLSKNPYKLISYATFGELYYNITPTLKITAGLRWTVDKKEAPRIPSWLIASYSVGYPVLEVLRQEWREPTGRFTLDWKPTDETLLYASYSHGYKAGGTNPPPPMIASYTRERPVVQESIVAPKTFNPEFVNAFEVGSKSTLDDGRVTLNGDAFYYDYTGYQISQIINRSAVNYNFDSRIWGLELEASWRPLENLQLGLKAGYENTRIAKGSKAIDIMDRTAGHPGWVVVRPFPTVPSNCILPDYVLNYSGSVNVQHTDNGGMGPCVWAYLLHMDPITRLPYQPNPPSPDSETDTTGYIGFDPSTAPNNGEGFYKDLSGHELPNAPHYTVTVTADYTIPLPNDWLATLHGDFYEQSEAWTRVFNTPGYDKLKAYNNVNLAAIFSNEDRGWQVMAYVKNVLNKDNITGAFLNSDDTGLTTNVFLNEPRLYGLRVTKNWSGSPWWTSGSNRTSWPFTVEVGGQVERHDAPNAPMAPELGTAFPSFDPLGHQSQNLDWGDGREVKVSYRPTGGWGFSLGAQFDKTNHTALPVDLGGLPPLCAVQGTPFESLCALLATTNPSLIGHQDTYVRSRVVAGEDHLAVDFLVNRDVGFGSASWLQSSLGGVGLRYAKLDSKMTMHTSGVPQLDRDPNAPGAKYEDYDRYIADMKSKRAFEGAGPMFNWDAAAHLFGGETNHLDLAWSAGAGVLFGRQKTDIQGYLSHDHFHVKYFGGYVPFEPTYTHTTPADYHRNKSVAVPVLDLSAGLAWQVERFKVGAGYRWERYYNAIDGGFDQHKSYDRTIDGPYFKVSLGFGG